MSSLLTAMAALVLAASGPNPFLAQAKVHYEALDYLQCLRRLEQGASWPSAPPEAAQLQVYTGLCRFGSDDVEGATLAFQHAATLDPTVTLPPYTSPKVREAFRAATETQRAQPAAPTPAPILPPRDPPQDLLPRTTALPMQATPSVAREQRNSRRGVGAWTFVLGGVSVGALGAGVGLGFAAQSTAGQARGARFESDSHDEGQRARAQALGANVSYGVAVAALVGTVVTWVVRGSR